eukprot:scaffold4125_cov126-Isochrysis_galbana.AAC.2
MLRSRFCWVPPGQRYGDARRYAALCLRHPPYVQRCATMSSDAALWVAMRTCHYVWRSDSMFRGAALCLAIRPYG